MVQGARKDPNYTPGPGWIVWTWALKVHIKIHIFNEWSKTNLNSLELYFKKLNFYKGIISKFLSFGIHRKVFS